MSKRHLVLDTSVLSAFASGDWFHSVSFWNDEYEVLTTERIWSDEFTPHHDYTKPDWLTLAHVDTEQSMGEPAELSVPDLTLVRLAENRSNPVLVSNDRRLIDEAEHREVEWMWGTKFLIQTFEACGIDEEPFRAGLSAYITDVHLPETVAEEVRSAEKD